MQKYLCNISKQIQGITILQSANLIIFQSRNKIYNQMHSYSHHPPSNIQSEYQLVDPERLKQDLRNSRTIPDTKLTQKITHTCTIHSRDQPQSIDNSIELPVSHSLKCSDQKQQSLSQQIDKGFLSQNLKEIENVMYGEVFRQKNTATDDVSLAGSTSPKTTQKGDRLVGSRFKQNDEIKVYNNEYSRESEQLVRNYQKLKIQRLRHREAGYFKNKQRSVEEIELDELFEKYKRSETAIAYQELFAGQTKAAQASHQDQQLMKQQNINKQQQFTQQIKYKSYGDYSKYKQSEQTIAKQQQAEEKIAVVTGRECALCKLSKLSHKHHKQQTETTSNKLQQSQQTHFETEEQWQIETNPVHTEQRVSRINASPDKSKMRYLSSEDKRKFNRKNSVEPDQSLLEAGKLKKQYLREIQAQNMQNRQKLITSQRPQLKHIQTASAQKISESAVSGKYRTPRKKIFSGIEVVSSGAHIKIESDQKQKLHNYQTHQVKATQKRNPFASNSPQPRSYIKIFSSRKQKQSNKVLSPYKHKTITRQLDFSHFRQQLVSSRVKIFKSIDKEQKSVSQRKKSLIPALRLMEMSAQVRKWYQDNRKDIIYQAERICSYDLINRYMTQQQISSRLFSLVTGMVEPRRWVLLMVDEVYARLKDRYLPE